MRQRYLRIRRVLDVVISSTIIIVLSPLLGLVALSIRVNMGAPIFFRHMREGHKGTFHIIKFRTMINGAENIGGGYNAAELKLVPPLGSFLRKTSLDELPQLFNILKGDMSFVGPRPAIPSQVERYTERQKMRLSVPQGVTGLAQLKYRNEATWSKRIETDLEYVESIGLVTDIKILLATPAKVIRGSGVRMDQAATDVDDLGVHRAKGEGK